VRGKVSAAFEDKGEQTVKNIAHPVRAFAVRAAGDAVAKAAPAADEIDLSLPDKPSIAVLPFTNMSGDPEQEYFTDGICEDIITELSRFQSLFVIARNSSFTYKGKAVDIKQVGKELGVRYVLEGSIRKAANRIRVTAQLIDTLTGGHIWAEKYDRVLEDIFAVQEEVTECIVGAIAPQVDAAETLRSRRRPGNLTAYELAVHASALAAESQQKSDVAARDEALRLGREALVLDAQSVLALSAIAYAQWLHVVWRTTGDRHAAWREAMDAVMRAIAIGPSSSLHAMRALLLAFAPGGGRWDEARIEAELAWRLNPQDFFALGPCGYILANTGQPLEGIRLLERALRINPRDPRAFFAYANLANAHLAAREYAKGLEWARRATGSAPNYGEAFLWTAGLYVGLGDIDKAKSALERARALAPDYIQYLLQSHSRIETPNPRKPVDGGTESRRRIQIFLRIAAGLEDPSAAEALR
jgi:adenylate cyclase